MAFFRAYIAPVLIVLIFAIAMLAVSARIFLPSDMMAPAPIEEMQESSIPAAHDLSALTPTDIPTIPVSSTELPPALSTLIHGQPDDAV